MLRLIRQHPILGLVAALSLEAWLAVPGEAMIALAASTVVGEALGWLRMTVCGVAGMLINDLTLFGLSRVGRGVLVQWVGVHTLRHWSHWHLSTRLVLWAKFLPPLRSAAYVIYGLQGAPFLRFAEVSVVSSLIWVTLYGLIGRKFHGGIVRSMDWLLGTPDGPRRPWVTAAELGLTVAAVAAFWI